jgi:hypothetical protein
VPNIELSRELEKIDVAYRELSELGYSFYVTGNYKVAHQLYKLAGSIKGSPHRISSLINQANIKDLDQVNTQLRAIIDQTFNEGGSS